VELSRNEEAIDENTRCTGAHRSLFLD